MRRSRVSGLKGPGTRVQASVLQTLVWSLLSRRILHHHHTACPSKKDKTKHAETC